MRRSANQLSGEFDSEFATAAVGISVVHLAPQLLGNFSGNGEPQAGTGELARVTSVRLGKTLEEVGLKVGVDTWSVIADANVDG